MAPGGLDILDRDGSYLGTTTALPGLPRAFGPDGQVVFFDRGAYDVPVARVYRLTWP